MFLCFVFEAVSMSHGIGVPMVDVFLRFEQFYFGWYCANNSVCYFSKCQNLIFLFSNWTKPYHVPGHKTLCLPHFRCDDAIGQQ